MTKKELRNIFKEKRKALSVHDIEKFNDLILINFQKLKLPFINCVHTYVASLKLGEPDTATIVRYLQFINPLTKIVIPKVDIHSGSISHYHFEEGMELITNAYGIDEPKEGNLISEDEIDLVLIPLLAFDKKGFRVGFGKGYYDKFLARCKPNVIKTGLSFFDPVDEIKDISGFDIPLNFCITPKEIFSFSL
ncbi:MAG TPA: 5-formyltetrahydrofolate cyclo-ligase [Hanamia sp.]|jgi:5-formyltetrahydrofolate cyclo-ligase|nr:5-formyltetrahydrofolate cyclo-ligase [Hanamia sp.]